MSQPSIQDVAAAVRSVVLTRNGVANHSRPPADVFPERLLSLRHAESIARGVREVRVAPGTVVTPLARDFLKRQGIDLRFVSRSEGAGVRDQGEWGFAIDVESGVVTALRRALLDDPKPWTELGPDAIPSRWVGEAPGRGAFLLTDDASVAVWKACQSPGVRAASVVDIDTVVRAVRRLGVNLLVVEPSGKSIATLRQMGQEFRRAGAPTLPAELAREGTP